MDPSLKRLLEEPLGKPAYWFDDIFNDKCKSVGKSVLTLSSVMLSCGNKPTGLTYCEPTQPECDKKFVRDNGVLVRGVITVKTDDWLTPEGRQALTKELRERDTKARRVAGCDRTTSNLTIGQILKSKHKVRVWIQLDKPYKYAAQYLFAEERVPGGLCLWIDPGRGWYFCVDSMDSLTSDRSQLYLARYRIAYEMRELVRAAVKRNRDNISPKDRKPDWFAEQYMRFRAPGEEKNRYEDIKQGVLKLFLQHSDWLIQDQKRQQNNRLFDPATWERWIESHSQARNPNDLEDFMEDDYMIVDSDTPEYDIMDVDDICVLQSRTTTRESSASLPQHQTAGRKRQLSPGTSRSSSPGGDDDLQRDNESSGLEYIDNPGELAEPDYYRPSSEDESDAENYMLDADFSSDEFLPDSDSDSDDGYVPSRQPTEPAVVRAIPYVLTKPPTVPFPGAPWFCPVQACNHEINMYDLSLEDHTVDVLPKESRDWIRSGGWSWQNPNLKRCFYSLVSAHYENHLESLGIVLEGGHKDLVAKWKYPEEHPSKHGKVIVKKERQASERRSTPVDIKAEPSQ